MGWNNPGIFIGSLVKKGSLFFPVPIVGPVSCRLVSVEPGCAKGIPGGKISPQDVAKAIVNAVGNNTPEVRVGFTETYYNLYLQSPHGAFNAMHGIK
jgi:hypothetical protein